MTIDYANVWQKTTHLNYKLFVSRSLFRDIY